MNNDRVFSSGGGVQSTAALVLAAEGKINFPVFLFSNVGEDSENPDTLIYVREVAMPYAAKHGIEFHEIRRPGETLYQRTIHEERSIRIPIRMKNGAPGQRTCTQQFKRSVIHGWLGKGQHTVGIGISMDEFQRMNTDSGYKNIVNEYPLIDLRLTRADCLGIIKAASLPQPPKSACWFCPFHNLAAWQEIRRTKPELFQKAIELEVLLNQKRQALGRDAVFLTSRGRPIDQVIGDQPSLFEDEGSCESGYCMV